ncbi:MAG: 50S ribosomal protein L5 [bacterium]|nr:50S ribosomal protein L5 [bacterium]MCX7917422.1 50S ribosomal protein L5 [bacterium]MDW8163337.1 50S ribosomal protein L5 [Candidatus Omnitrophota bacterium]
MEEPRLKKIYRESVVPKLMDRFKYKNVMQVPKILKIVLNMGIGRDNKDSKAVEAAQKELTLIAGQKAVLTKAKKSIAGFNVRKGNIVGVMVTLRGNKMYEFLDRLITVALPRVRDFEGLPKNSTDGRGSYTIGIKEHVIFPEVDYNTIYKVQGMNVTIVTSAKTPEETISLLKEIGLPIRED